MSDGPKWIVLEQHGKAVLCSRRGRYYQPVADYGFAGLSLALRHADVLNAQETEGDA